jgi:hypothetical protein
MVLFPVFSKTAARQAGRMRRPAPFLPRKSFGGNGANIGAGPEKGGKTAESFRKRAGVSKGRPEILRDVVNRRSRRCSGEACATRPARGPHRSFSSHGFDFPKNPFIGRKETYNGRSRGDRNRIMLSDFPANFPRDSRTRPFAGVFFRASRPCRRVSGRCRAGQDAHEAKVDSS